MIMYYLVLVKEEELNRPEMIRSGENGKPPLKTKLTHTNSSPSSPIKYSKQSTNQAFRTHIPKTFPQPKKKTTVWMKHPKNKMNK